MSLQSQAQFAFAIFEGILILNFGLANVASIDTFCDPMLPQNATARCDVQLQGLQAAPRAQLAFTITTREPTLHASSARAVGSRF